MQGTSPFTPFQHNISPFVIGETPKASSHKDNLNSTPKTEASSPSTQLMEDVTMGMDSSTPPRTKDCWPARKRSEPHTRVPRRTLSMGLKCERATWMTVCVLTDSKIKSLA